jgi:hypothetical protein
MSEQEIVSCAIYPGIGVARVGNAPQEFFIGPEVPGVTPTPEDGYKDRDGLIKRQAARFRLYGLDAEGRVVRELTAHDVDSIEWTVHLVNKKAAWYEFNVALDIPEASDKGNEAKRRNLHIVDADRQQLIIDPQPRTVSGTSASATFGTGMFMGTEVPLGEIRTDAEGRLIVLGGLGHSASHTGEKAVTFANNDGWHDDTSDGPVSARVVLNGRELPVEPAWVLVAPPDFAPGVLGVVTLYDIVYQAALDLDPGLYPSRVSFTEHIYPLFQRMNQTQWVNEGFYLELGYGSAGDFLEPTVLARLSDSGQGQRAFREMVFSKFRNPDYQSMDRDALPPMYGDGMDGTAHPTSPREWLAITPVQYDCLRRWAAGDFEADWTGEPQVRAQHIEDLPLADQPSALDRAALENCLGGAFHPGCEATWPMRHASMYDKPFRIKSRAEAKDDYGSVLTPQQAVAADGPLNGNAAGDITRWMAVPWQTDTASCLSGYASEVNPYLPTFWPARVPNQVLSQASYKALMNDDLPDSQRVKYFNLRENWYRDFSPNYKDTINEFITDWNKIGIIVPHPGPVGHPSIPTELRVEMGNAFEQERDGYQLVLKLKPEAETSK